MHASTMIREHAVRNKENPDYPALQIACFNDIHCNFGVRHLEYSVRYLEYPLQVYIELLHSTSIIWTFRLSGWLPAQRGPDNRGSTVATIQLLWLQVYSVQ